MTLHIGTKLINATPLTREEYNTSRGWTVPADENPEDKGFLIEHLSHADAGSIEYSGYVSWLPEKEFREHYQQTDSMDFGAALNFLESGAKVARKGWNGKNMFLFLVKGSTFSVNRPPLLGIYPEGTEVNYHAHVDMKTASGEIVPWLCSQTDMLAKDWVLVK